MRVVANGTAYEGRPGLTVAGFIRARGLDPRYVVVEHNGEALERRRYEDTELADGDRLELVRAVAGGSPAQTTGVDGRRDRLAAARLYVVTDARVGRGDLFEFLEAILGAGAGIVQLREKGAEAGDILRWGETFREATERHGALFIVNDRPDVALALDADGVHVGQNDLPPAVARRLLGPERIVGLSCHSPQQLDGAPAEADYVTAGPIHETPTKPGRPGTGLGVVRHAAATQPRARPWFAIGGIDPEALPAVVAAGARRVVVVRAVTEAPDPGQAVQELLAGLPAAG